MWQSLFANLAVAAFVLATWTAVGDWVARFSPLSRRLLFGAVMGIGTVGSMAMAFQPAPGIYFDFRMPLIVLTCLYGGVPAAAVVAAPALLYRISLGGEAMLGSLAILVSVAMGLYGARLRGRDPIRLTDIVDLGIATSGACACLSLALFARGSVSVMRELAAPVLLTFVGTLMFGIPLLQEQRRRVLSVTNGYYRSMVEALPDCLNIKDLDGRFLAANPATATLMRAASPQDLIGKTDFDFYPPDLAERFRQDELQVLLDRQHVAIEQPGLLPNGRMGWLSTLKAPLRDESGEVVGLITHNRDVTDRAELQGRLASTQAMLDSALDTMTDGLAIYAKDGTLLFCNAQYRDLFPRTAHLRVPGASYADIVRASLESGETAVPAGQSLEENIASHCEALHREGEIVVEFLDGRIFACRTKALPDGAALRMMADVTARRSFEKNLEHQALHDPLTGMPNRALFNRELAAMLRRAQAEGGELAVMLLDLDHFKAVNDSFGHAVGDALLVEVSRRIQLATRRGDIATRLGGDEFAILMSGSAGSNGAPGLAARILKMIARPLTIDNVALLPGGTVGYTIYPQDNSGPEGLLRNADRALYRAKAIKRGTWKAFDPAEFEAPAALAG